MAEVKRVPLRGADWVEAASRIAAKMAGAYVKRECVPAGEVVTVSADIMDGLIMEGIVRNREDAKVNSE